MNTNISTYVNKYKHLANFISSLKNSYSVFWSYLPPSPTPPRSNHPFLSTHLCVFFWLLKPWSPICVGHMFLAVWPSPGGNVVSSPKTALLKNSLPQQPAAASSSPGQERGPCSSPHCSTLGLCEAWIYRFCHSRFECKCVTSIL